MERVSVQAGTTLINAGEFRSATELSLVQAGALRGAGGCSFLRQGRLGPVSHGQGGKAGAAGAGASTKPASSFWQARRSPRGGDGGLARGRGDRWSISSARLAEPGAAGGPAPAFRLCFISSHSIFDELCSCSIMSTFVSANGAEQPFSLQAVAYSKSAKSDLTAGSPGRGFGRCRDSVR